MANTKSALKRIRSNARKRERNRIIRSSARTAVKKARRAILEGSAEEAKAAVRQAVSALDRAAEKGVIHKNNAARRKSRLIKLFNQNASPAQP